MTLLKAERVLFDRVVKEPNSCPAESREKPEDLRSYQLGQFDLAELLVLECKDSKSLWEMRAKLEEYALFFHLLLAAGRKV